MIEEIKVEVEEAVNQVEDQQSTYEEMIHQLGFDLLSFLSARVSSELGGTNDSILKFW